MCVRLVNPEWTNSLPSPAASFLHIILALKQSPLVSEPPEQVFGSAPPRNPGNFPPSIHGNPVSKATSYVNNIDWNPVEEFQREYICAPLSVVPKPPVPV